VYIEAHTKSECMDAPLGRLCSPMNAPFVSARYPEPASFAPVERRMQTVIQHKALRNPPPGASELRRDSDREASDMTDRPFRFPARDHASGASTRAPLLSSECARFRWIIENDVQTEFLDAGIGCCWFAYQDDKESAGETEDDALERLARENGLELWRDTEERKGKCPAI